MSKRFINLYAGGKIKSFRVAKPGTGSNFLTKWLIYFLPKHFRSSKIVLFLQRNYFTVLTIIRGVVQLASMSRRCSRDGRRISPKFFKIDFIISQHIGVWCSWLACPDVYSRDGRRISPKFFKIDFIISQHIGVWCSWLACLHGVQVVAGSSPATPTDKRDNLFKYRLSLFCFISLMNLLVVAGSPRPVPSIFFVTI